jgi:nitroreductase
MSITESLKWRYATKVFSSARLGQEDIDMLLETLRLSPTSFGLQPFVIIDASSPSLREPLAAAALGQPQIASASHLLFLAVPETIEEQHVVEFIERAAVARGVSRESLAPRQAQIWAYINRFDVPQRKAWAEKQAYLALGFLLSAAAQLEIDACPMEGFDKAAVDEILQLRQKGLAATVLVAIGKRSPSDTVVSLPKVRKSLEAIYLKL